MAFGTSSDTDKRNSSSNDSEENENGEEIDEETLKKFFSALIKGAAEQENDEDEDENFDRRNLKKERFGESRRNPHSSNSISNQNHFYSSNISSNTSKSFRTIPDPENKNCSLITEMMQNCFSGNSIKKSIFPKKNKNKKNDYDDEHDDDSNDEFDNNENSTPKNYCDINEKIIRRCIGKKDELVSEETRRVENSSPAISNQSTYNSRRSHSGFGNRTRNNSGPEMDPFQGGGGLFGMMNQIDRMFEEEARLMGSFFGGGNNNSGFFGGFDDSFEQDPRRQQSAQEWDPFERRWKDSNKSKNRRTKYDDDDEEF